MKYMVMECHLSYAVVLDEEGRFLKVANRHYEVGQTVTDIIEMQVPQSVSQKKKTTKLVYSLAAMAACLVLMVTSVFQMEQITYASVYMTINPEVRIDVNRYDVVVGLDGINSDGDNLIAGYEYKKKKLNLVMDELVNRAIDMSYLHEGGQISLVLDADNDEWIINHSDTLTTQLNEHLNEKLSVTIEVTNKKEQGNQVVIPVAPKENDYGKSSYDEAEQSTIPSISSQTTESDYNDRTYGDNSYDNSQSNYGESEYIEDRQSNYDKESNYDAGESDYKYAHSDYWETQSNYTDYEGQSEHDSAGIETSGNSDYSDDGQSDYSSVTDYEDSQSDNWKDAQSDYDYDDNDSDYDDSDYDDSDYDDD